MNSIGGIRGCDLSHHNEQVDFDVLKKPKEDGGAGFEFAILKASEGILNHDPTFRFRRPRAVRAGLIVGSYHFYRPGRSIQAQIQDYLVSINDIQKGELPPIFDWEVQNSGVNREVQINEAYTWLVTLERKVGLTPIVYTGPSLMEDEIKPPKEFARFPLWISHYGVKTPRVPAPWTSWTFWQTSESGFTPGVKDAEGNPDEVDLDIFNGTIDDLKKLCRR